MPGVRAQKLPQVVETRVVTRTVLEFIAEVDSFNHPHFESRLRVTVDPDAITIRLVDEPDEPDTTIRWYELVEWSRAERAIAEYEEEARVSLEVQKAIQREAECVIAIARGARQTCRAPDCHVESTPLVERDSCDPAAFGPAWGVR